MFIRITLLALLGVVLTASGGFAWLRSRPSLMATPPAAAEQTVPATGLRPVRVSVGSSGRVWPGDRVDLLLTIDRGDTPRGRRIFNQPLLQNVRVIAADQQPGGGNPSARTVTLELTPADTERVQAAAPLGTLSLLVVSAEDAPQHLPAIFPAPPGPAVSAQPAAADARSLRVFDGPADSKEFRF